MGFSPPLPARKASDLRTDLRPGVIGVAPLFLLIGAAAVVLAAFFYLREEVPVRGRGVLLGLRIAVLLLVTLLLLDPTIPGEDPARPESPTTRWVLFDGELSLLLPAEGNGTLWTLGVDRVAEAVSEGARVALPTPGTRGPEGVDTTALRLRAPDHPIGDLIEGIARLGEGGADTILILSTLRREPDLFDRLGRATTVPLRIERLGGLTRNAGIGALDLPERLPEGEPIVGRVSIFGEGGLPGDSVELELRIDGDPVWAARLPLPAPGAELFTEVRLPPPPVGRERLRFSLSTTLPGDAFPIDDQRAHWAEIGEPEEGVLLLSLRPDWEPRILLPVLEAVTGLEGSGYLRVGEEEFLSLAEGSEGGGIVGPEAFRDRVLQSRILVLHGGSIGIEGWLDAMVRSHPRVIHLPADLDGVSLAGVAAAERWEGSWIVEPEPPLSPVSPFLSGIRFGVLPPLGSLLPPTTGRPLGMSVFNVRRGEIGDPLPALLLREGPDRRWAVLLVDGLWRWGSRPGEPREAYRALWGGVADWLLEVEGAVGGPLAEPNLPISPRGMPLEWRVRGGGVGAELLLLPLPLDVDGGWSADPEVGVAPAFRGILTPGEDGIAATAPVAPGLYRYEVRGVGSEPGAPAVTAGLVEVEGWAPSLRLPPLEVPDTLIEVAGEMGAEEGSGGRPLRSHPFPYLLILLLLTAEWVGRRWVGLR